MAVIEQKYVALAKAIAQKESGGRANIYGDNNTSYGLGQWNNNKQPLKKGDLPAVWKEHATQVLGNANAPMTEQNQKAVLAGMVKLWAERDGLQPFEIAAKWNSGSSKGWENKVGTTVINGKKISYSTPEYVKQVDTYYRQFLGGQEVPQEPFAFKREDDPAKRKAQIANLQAEAEAAAKDAKKQNSVGGFLKNFGNEFIRRIAGSEVGLGETLGQSLATGKVAAGLTEANIMTGTVEMNLLKEIKRKRDLGLDTATLERAYNQLQKDKGNLPALEDIVPAINKTDGQVLGEIGGTALDVLTAGTYGKSASLMQTGKLSSSTNKVLQSTVANHLKSTEQIMKNLPADEIARLGGPQKLIERTSVNIVDQLRKQGLTRAADEIARMSPASFASIADYSRALSGLVPGVSKLTGITTAVSPELGKVASIGSKATGLFTRKGATNVAKGAGIGYAYDITQGLQGFRGEEREGAAAFIPGLGTAIGGAIPLITETSQSVTNRFDKGHRAHIIVDNRVKELDKLDDYTNVQKRVAKAKARGIDVKRVAAETDVLHGAVDKTGTITTKGEGMAVDQYNKLFVDPNEAIVSEALAKEGRSVAPNMVKTKITEKIKSSGLEGRNLTRALSSIDDEMAGYGIRSGQSGVIPLTTLHQAKVDKYANINFMTAPEKQRYDKAVAEALKEIIETETKSVDVKGVNAELSKHYEVIGYLEALNGKKVEGGRLGKYFARTLGAIVGGHFGPLGAIVGAETAAGVKGANMATTFGAKANRIIPEAEVLVKAKDFIKAKPLELPAAGETQSLNSLGKRNSNQATTITPTINDIPKSSSEKPKVSISLSTAPKDVKELIKKQGGVQKTYLYVANADRWNNLERKFMDWFKATMDAARKNMKDPKNGQGGFIANPFYRDGAKVKSDIAMAKSEKMITTPKSIPVKKIAKEDTYEMADFIDYAEGIYKPTDKQALQMEKDAAIIARRYGISEEGSIKQLAARFRKVLDTLHGKGKLFK